MSQKPFYITTTLPYVNGDPHIGFALEVIRADIVARYRSMVGHEVFFNTGTDEHGVKIYQKAQQLHLDPQAYTDQAAQKFKDLLPALNIATDVEGIEFNFIRTTDKHHVAAAQAFWKLVDENGKKAPDGPYIYKKHYSVKYCVGCELEKTDSELVDGRCPLHPLRELELIQEENYFFKFSAFGKRLLDLYQNEGEYAGRKDQLVIPDFRFNEIKAFVERGLQDFSISRLSSKMPWGIPVPGDEDQVMYVWFDALVNYISAIGWPDDQAMYDTWAVQSGGMVQYCGKDNLRQQSAMWQAMLMAAGLSPSRTIVIDGFITGEGGVKMSKSLGNTVDPVEITKEYGADPLRYFVARELSPFEDSPFTHEKFKESFNANLANGIGNLTSRIMKMAEANIEPIAVVDPQFPDEYVAAFEAYDLQRAANVIWKRISELDSRIQVEKPFSMVKEDPAKGKKVIAELAQSLYEITFLLEPFMPSTAATIRDLVRSNKMPAQPLFQRK